MILTFFFVFLLFWLIGTFSFWLVGRFSASPPPLIASAIGALILGIFYFILRPLPSLFFWAFYFLAVWIAMIKIAQIEKSYSFFGAVFYIVVTQIILFFILAFVM